MIWAVSCFLKEIWMKESKARVREIMRQCFNRQWPQRRAFAGHAHSRARLIFFTLPQENRKAATSLSPISVNYALGNQCYYYTRQQGRTNEPHYRRNILKDHIKYSSLLNYNNGVCPVDSKGNGLHEKSTLAYWRKEKQTAPQLSVLFLKEAVSHPACLAPVQCKTLILIGLS